MQRLQVDAKKCVACRICELACSFQHVKQFDPELSRIRVYVDDGGGLEIELKSCDCTREVCVELCPAQALGFALPATNRLNSRGGRL